MTFYRFAYVMVNKELNVSFLVYGIFEFFCFLDFGFVVAYRSVLIHAKMQSIHAQIVEHKLVFLEECKNW